MPNDVRRVWKTIYTMSITENDHKKIKIEDCKIWKTKLGPKEELWEDTSHLLFLCVCRSMVSLAWGVPNETLYLPRTITWSAIYSPEEFPGALKASVTSQGRAARLKLMSSWLKGQFSIPQPNLNNINTFSHEHFQLFSQPFEVDGTSIISILQVKKLKFT